MSEDDYITKDTWFLRDVMKYYQPPGGDMGATLTPGSTHNMNIQAQIFLQLQRNGQVTVKQYVEELTMVLLENYSIISKLLH